MCRFSVKLPHYPSGLCDVVQIPQDLVRSFVQSLVPQGSTAGYTSPLRLVSSSLSQPYKPQMLPLWLPKANGTDPHQGCRSFTKVAYLMLEDACFLPFNQ